MVTDSAQLEQKIETANKILLVYGENANFSSVAAALSIYLWLRGRGKSVTIVSPSEPVVEFSPLVGINKVKTKLAGENMVVKLPLPASKIDKVISDLNQVSDELSLIIKPKKPGELTAISNLPVTFQAPDFDLIWMLDVRRVEELERLATTGANYWTTSEHNITWNDFANPAPVPAVISVQLGKDDSLAAAWGRIVRESGWSMDTDQASNILMALEHDSDHFGSLSTSAEIFELAAWLLRQGAVRYRPDEQAVANFSPQHHLPHPPQMPQMVGISAAA